MYWFCILNTGRQNTSEGVKPYQKGQEGDYPTYLQQSLPVDLTRDIIIPAYFDIYTLVKVTSS